jgi:integrase
MAASSSEWSASTRRPTLSLVEHHLKPHLGEVPVTKITTADLDLLYARLQERGGRDGKPLSAGTVRRIHVALHRSLALAVRCEWIWRNPASNADTPRCAQAEIRPPTPDQVATLLAYATSINSALHLFLLLSATTGARRGELLALRWADVDLEAGSIAIQRSFTEGPTGPVLAPTKTRRWHRVALDEMSLDAVAKFRADQGVVDPCAPCRFVFSHSSDGATPWLPNWITKTFVRCRRQAGLPHFRLHDLRHFMATEMLDAGVPITVVSARLAHARASTTLNAYAHAVPGADREAAELLARRLLR